MPKDWRLVRDTYKGEWKGDDGTRLKKGPTERPQMGEGENPGQREQVLDECFLLALDLLADHRLPVVASHIVEFHPVPEKERKFKSSNFINSVFKNMQILHSTLQKQVFKTWNKTLKSGRASDHSLSDSKSVQIFFPHWQKVSSLNFKWLSERRCILAPKTSWRCQSFWGIVQPC